MDSPQISADSSSPVVILPSATTTTFSLPININMADINTTFPARSTHPRTRNSIRTRRISNHQTVSIVTHNTPSHSHGVAHESTHTNTHNAATGPTTRSRKRNHNNSNTNATAALVAATVQTTRRQTMLTLSSKRNRAKKARFSDNRKMPPPGRKKAPVSLKPSDDDDATDKKPAAATAPATESCCICMGDVEPNDLASINGCDHRFCFGCIEKWSERENKCPLCKLRFTKINRVNKKRKKGTKNTLKVKDRDQRSDLVPGAALQGLLANLNRNTGSLARIILGNYDFGGGGVGFGATISTSGPGGSATRASFASRSGRSRNGANFSALDFDTFDDSSDDDSPMSQFMRVIHGGSAPSGVRMSTAVVRPMSVTARFTTTSTSRSYARNSHDATAGNGAENPLEIDDDSVGEVIEID